MAPVRRPRALLSLLRQWSSEPHDANRHQPKIELPDSAANAAGMKAQGKPPHSVFTVDLIDAPNQPTRRAVDEVIAFFRKALLEVHSAT